MIRVSLKGLAARPIRAVLTALAIVLGVAMVSGSFVVTDTITKAFDTIFTSSYAHTDAVVSKKSLVDYSNSGNGTIPQSLLVKIQRLPEVGAAAGSIIDLNNDTTNTKLIDRDGNAIDANGNPTFGFGVDPSRPRFNPLHLVAGTWAHGRHEVVIDSNTAKKHHFAVGDFIDAAAKGPKERFQISGIAKYGDVDTLGGATIAVFTIPTAQDLLELEGFTAISVAAKPGVSQDRLVREIQSVVPGDVQVKTADEQAKADKKNVDTFLSFIRGFLLGFGGIALFVGAFVIFNTLSITIAQRTRELATLRTLGASRRQVLRSVIVESLAIGVLASLIGIAAGIGLARGLTALFDVMGLSLPQSSPVYATRTFVVALLLGVLVTLFAGLWPAGPPSDRAGKPTSFARPETSAGAKPATPSRPIRVPAASASRLLPAPRFPPRVAYAISAVAIPNNTAPAIGPSRLRRSSTAPSRTAAIGGTRVARTAGQRPAKSVTRTPSSSATTKVLVA